MSSKDRWYTAARWVICAAVFLYSVGFAIAVFTRVGTSWGGVALMAGVPDPTIRYWEKVAAVLMLLGGVSLLVRPILPVALLMGVAIAAEAYGKLTFGGEPFVEWSMWSAALRYSMPLALLPLLGFLGPLPPTRTRVLIAMWILRIGLAIVFAIHGLQALGRHPWFIDLLIGSSRSLLGYRLTESNAVSIMMAIGVVDLLVALAILVGRWRPLLAWLCFWSTITAFSRMTSLGVMSYPEVLLRASHILAPVAVWCMGTCVDAVRHAGATSKPIAINDDEHGHITPTMGDAARVT